MLREAQDDEDKASRYQTHRRYKARSRPSLR